VSHDDGSGYNSEVTTAVVIVIIIAGICTIVALHKNVLFCSLPPTAPFLSPPDAALRSKATPLTAAPPPLCAAAACKQEHVMLMAAVMMI
jgi:hypothetical protein